MRSRERNNADRESRDRYALLSEREREVLGLIVTALTNKEIGRALTLSPRTVETHRANLFAKLEVESLAVLIRRFAGLLEAGEGDSIERNACGPSSMAAMDWGNSRQNSQYGLRSLVGYLTPLLLPHDCLKLSC